MITMAVQKENGTGVCVAGTLHAVWGLPETEHERILCLTSPITNLPPGVKKTRKIFSRKEIAKVELIYDGYKAVHFLDVDETDARKQKVGMLLSIEQI